MGLFEVKSEIAPEAVEAVDDVLLERGVDGWSLLQDVIAKRAWVVGVFASEAEARDQWAGFRPLMPAEARGADPTWRELADQDWKDSYKAHFKPWSAGRLHWVPVWERGTYPLGGDDVAVWLDPGLAFGTGNHETTRLCCERLVAFAAGDGWQSATGGKRAEARVIDAGCGSGILALSAARLGFADVVGFDNDPEAVRISGENAALNGLEGAVRFFEGDLVTGLAGRQVELVMANILADVLMRFTKELTEAVAPGGWLVLSGILAHEGPKVQAVFTEAAPEWAMESRVLGEWCDVVLKRP